MVLVVAVVASVSGAAAFVLAIPLGLGLIALLVYLWTVLSFAPPLIVLERLGVFAAIKRSVKLVKGDFWRVLGIRLLATIVAGVVAAAVSIPFSLTGQILLLGSESTTTIFDRARAGRDRRRGRPDHHRAVQRGRGRAALHRSPDPCRGVRLGAADRRGDRAPARHPTRPTTCGSPGSPDVPAIDIDRDAAHEAAQRELAKPIYPKASLTERLSEWLDDLLYRIAQEGSSLPGGWFTISVLLIILAVAIVVAVRIARRTMRTNRGGEHALFDSHELSAAQHRATAEQYAAAG